MVRAWFMDDSAEDQRKPHMTDPPQFVSLEDLKKLGVLYFEVHCRSNDMCSLFTPPNLINIQGHELEGAFIVHTLACLEIYGQITH